LGTAIFPNVSWSIFVLSIILPSLSSPHQATVARIRWQSVYKSQFAIDVSDESPAAAFQRDASILVVGGGDGYYIKVELLNLHLLEGAILTERAGAITS
jgi:predicted S18 family serine protease